MYTTKLSLNRLTIRTFSVFWIALFVMTTLLVILPYFDGHLYSELDDNEIATYQQKLVESIRNNKIKGLLAGVPVLPTDKFDSARPVLITPNKEVFGALGEEKTHILQFFDESTNFTIPQRKTLRYMLNHPWVLLLMTLIITTPLLWWFTYTIVKPITKLQKAANSVALGDFKVDNELANQGPSELREVGQSFNKMSIAINNLISNQHNLLSSISHELKTPLTRLQLSTALIRHKVGNIDAVERIEKEISRMDKMISELLLISRQKMHSQMEHNLFTIDHLWTDVIKDALFEAEQRKIICDVNISILHPEQHTIYGNLRLLTSAIENIIRNALKYTKNKIFLTISLHRNVQENDYVQIRVEDNGLGLPPEEFEKIFKPFYRVDETRTRATGGTGLGLTIVANVVNEHQGKVWAEQSNLGGLAVTIQLPLWKQS